MPRTVEPRSYACVTLNLKLGERSFLGLAAKSHAAVVFDLPLLQIMHNWWPCGRTPISAFVFFGIQQASFGLPFHLLSMRCFHVMGSCLGHVRQAPLHSRISIRVSSFNISMQWPHRYSQMGICIQRHLFCETSNKIVRSRNVYLTLECVVFGGLTDLNLQGHWRFKQWDFVCSYHLVGNVKLSESDCESWADHMITREWRLFHSQSDCRCRFCDREHTEFETAPRRRISLWFNGIWTNLQCFSHQGLLLAAMGLLRCALASGRCFCIGLYSGDRTQKNSWDRFPTHIAFSTRIGFEALVWKGIFTQE